MNDREVTACVILIGNELLSGRTTDANLPYIAKGLGEIGIRLREARVIPDIEPVIVETVNACRARFDYVFVTGGIGPTHDDITAASVAKAFDVPLIRDPRARAILERRYAPEDLTEARLKMTEVPQGADLVDNPVSGAPGIRIENVFVFAGIPRIMQAMFDSVKPTLAGGAPMQSRTVVVYLPEGTVADSLRSLQRRYSDVEMGSYPFYRAPRFGTSLVLRGTDAARLAEAVAALEAALRELGGEYHHEEDPA